MTVRIENIYVCLLLPLLLAALFLRPEQRRFCAFVMLGMTACLCTACINGYLAERYCVSDITASIEIAPVCEESAKLLLLIAWVLIFEPDTRAVIPAAIALGVGFATFENCCFMMQSGAADFGYLLLRGLSAGATHILCGILTGFGLNLVWRRSWLKLIGTLGVLCLAISFHGIYNLLISAEGTLRIVGCALPSAVILPALIGKKMISKRMQSD